MIRKKLIFQFIQLKKQENQKKAKDFHLQIKNDTEWYTAMTNKNLRKEVLEYYDLPKEKQYKFSFQ